MDSAPSHHRKPLFVLIVDAFSDTREMYHEFLLGEESLVVITASTSELALQLCTEVTPHVVVADIGVRTDAGTSFWRDIRQLAGPEARLVAIADDGQLITPVEADAVLLKPVSAHALRDAVRPTAP